MVAAVEVALEDSFVPVVRLSQIFKYYGSGETLVKAVDGVSIDIYPGEYVAIMGASGSGKSTLMNIIGCLDIPTKGKYELDGIDVSNLDESALAIVRNRKIGFVFQSFHLLPRLTVLENVLLPQRYAAQEDPEAEKRARELLERVGLSHRIDHLPGELSGGQLQRAAIVRALLNQPALLRADIVHDPHMKSWNHM